MEHDLVLIRGIMSSSLHWWDFLPMMRTQFPKSQIYTPDILGNGLHFEMATPTKLEHNILGLRKQVPSSKKKIIIGFSLGGMFAIEWALKHPEEVEAIILINTSLSGTSLFKRFTPRSFFKILLSGMSKDLRKREESILKLTTKLKQEQLPQIAEVFMTIEKKHPTKTTNFFRQLYLATKVSLKNNMPSVPILILNSEMDQIVDPRCSHKISKTWNIPVVAHPTAGHDLTLDDPQWVAEQIQNWLLAQQLLKFPTNNLTEIQTHTLASL